VGGGNGKIFAGRLPGGVHLELTVREADKPRTAEHWLESARKAWSKAKRKTIGLAREKNQLFFSEKKYGVYEALHGYAFFARGYHGFELHAWVDDRTEASDQAIRKALSALKLGPNPGCGLLVRRFAGSARQSCLDPEVLLAAGSAYVTGNRFRVRIPALAPPILARARALAKPDTFTPAQHFDLEWLGGLALLEAGQAKEAIAWLTRAGRVAGVEAERLRRAAYDLARAYSVEGRVAEGLAALNRAFSGGMPVSKAQLSNEKELANLRRAPGWETFWARRIDSAR